MIQCNLDQQLILTPSNSPSPSIVIAVIQTSVDSRSGKTGVISWSGAVKAFLTFDPTGTQVISYTLTVNDYATEKSVENILRVL